MDRRNFLSRSSVAVAFALGLDRTSLVAQLIQDPVSRPQRPKLLYDISLAQWSLHRALRAKGEDRLDHLDFPATARGLGIAAVEYVNSFFKDKARDEKYLGELRDRCDAEGVRSLLIMCDGEGDLGDPDSKRRARAVRNHHRWVEAAKFLGCHAIRVNARSRGSYDEQAKLAAEGLRQLAE